MITLSELAADKLQNIMTEKGFAEHTLRLFVSGGGCAGLTYGMIFDKGPEQLDQVYETNGVKVIIDPASIQYLDGSEIHYIEEGDVGGFRIETATPVPGCACGSAFQSNN